MARAAVKAKQAQARATAKPTKPARGQRRRGSGGGNPNQDLFFMRLRRRQKWVFLALAVIFAATFAGVGVGSGNGGGLEQIWQSLLGGGGGTSVSKAQDEIKTNPVKGYQDLANAYLQQGDTQNAVTALQSYLRLKKNDVNAWTQVASLERQQGDSYVTLYQQALQQNQLANPAQAVLPTGALGTQLGSNPVGDYYAQQASTQSSQFAQLATQAYTTALQANQTIAKLQPRNAAAQFGIGEMAQRTQQSTVALKGFQRYVLLDPHALNLLQVEQACRSLGGICTPAYVKALKLKP